MARYSLAKYILTVSIPDNLVAEFGDRSVSIGGEGSYTDSITITRSVETWTTEGDSTGSYVHNQNLNKTGTAEVSLNQLSPQIAKFKTLCNLYSNADAEYDGLTLELSDTAGNVIATCNDCLINKIPDQQFQATAQNQSWVFTCGQIIIN